MAFAPPSGTNSFVPPSIARELTIDYAKSADAFAINDYCQRLPVKRSAGYYARINPDEKARGLSDDAREDLWPDGADSPSNADNALLFENVMYTTRRRRRGYVIGDRERQQSDVDLTKVKASMVIQQTMTKITRQALAALSGATWGDNTSTVSTLLGSGEYLDNGSSSQPNVKNALLQAQIEIEKATVGMIRGNDMVLVINPEAARKLSISPEVHQYLANSPHARGVIEGTINPNAKYGLPPDLYGFKLVVENTVKVTTRLGASSQTRNYAMDDDTLYLLSRPGGIEATSGTTAKSTLTLFHYTGDRPDGSEGKDYDGSEFSIEEFYDSKNRRTEGFVTWDIDLQVTTALGGFRFTNAFEPESS